MAMNPMQRRARNSFILGFLVAFIIGVLVAVALLMQIKSIKQAKEALEAKQRDVYVAKADIKSGSVMSQEEFAENFLMTKVITTVDKNQIIDNSDFEFTDASGKEITRIDENGNQITKNLIMKVSVPAGTIVTKDMFEEYDDQTQDSQRIQEYNMIALPSQLVNGDYIDIRIALPNGQDFIVVSKKQVLGTKATSIWLKLDEAELLSLNNAIVETYIMTGAKLYATQYIEPGMQEAAKPNYPVSQAVLNLINNNPNITEEARENLWAKYSSEIRVNYFESALSPYIESQDSLVSAGVAEELDKVLAGRKEYVESLEGTESVGYTR